MKTIIYFIIAALICITLASAGQKNPENRKKVILQATDTKVTIQLLKQSASIISDRLRTYGMQSYDVSIIADRGQIKVLLPEDAELSEVEGLLTLKGELAFYENLNRKDFADLLNLNKAGNPVLVRSDVDSVKSSKDKDSKSYVIEINFKPAATKIWANATKSNLNKPIAVVIDDKVFYDPVVRTIIENGLCEISGNLTLKDVNYFMALVNNGKLPLSFNILK